MKKITNYFYYLKDIVSDIASPNVKIESFYLTPDQDNLGIAYRLGRQKLLHRSILTNFEVDYYNKLSIYDKQRLTKFTAFHEILALLQKDNSPTKQYIIQHIEEEIKHDTIL